MLKIWLIRHGMTEGNRHQRYIGVTDEPLCEEGRKLLRKFTYPKPQAVFVSPLKRCLETAAILFDDPKVRIIDQLAECNFGEFENKNYKELSGDPRYQAWIAMEFWLSREAKAKKSVQCEIRKVFRERLLHAYGKKLQRQHWSCMGVRS